MGKIKKEEETKKVEPVHIENEEIEKYKLALQTYVTEDSPCIFQNAGINHALAFTSTIFAYAKNIKMISRGLGPDLASDKRYIQNVKEFLERPDSRLQIAIENDLYLNNEPLSFILQKMTEHPDRFSIYKIHKSVIKKVETSTGKPFPNLMLADGKIFRLENIPKEYKAFGSFNNSEEYDKLYPFFEAVIKNSDPVNIKKTDPVNNNAPEGKITRRPVPEPVW